MSDPKLYKNNTWCDMSCVSVLMMRLSRMKLVLPSYISERIKDRLYGKIKRSCIKDYIAVYSGSTISKPLMKKLCGKQKSTFVTHNGENLLVEFRSGPEIPPFDYNGFVATVNFPEITTEIPTTITMESTVEATGTVQNNAYYVRSSNRNLQDHRKDKSLLSDSCDYGVNGEEVRAGRYDTRDKVLSTVCHLTLQGRTYDTAHVALLSYNLRAPACQSTIEIFNGSLPGAMTTLEKICSPSQKLLQQFVQQDKNTELQPYSSNGRNMTVIFKRDSTTHLEEEYVEISYYFHDEREGGTQQPTSECDVEYFGPSSPTTGTIAQPESHRLFTMEGPVKCKQHFIPAANQSVIITVESSTKQSPSNNTCNTQCGDSGCRCASNKPVEEMDHLLLVSETGHIITCLCGNYQDWLPVGIRSWTPVHIEWSRSSAVELNFRATYKFLEDPYCGDYSIYKPEGEVNSGDLAKAGLQLNQYYQQKCTWILESSVDRQLTIEVKSTQSRPCTAWNLTIHEYKKNGDSAGPRLHTFCSRDKHKNFTLPWKMNTAVVRFLFGSLFALLNPVLPWGVGVTKLKEYVSTLLFWILLKFITQHNKFEKDPEQLQALGRTAPQYTMKWRSDFKITNSHKSGPSPASNHATSSSIKIKMQITYFFVLFVMEFLTLRSIYR